MKRAYYSNTIQDFIIDNESKILGELAANHSNRNLNDLQINAWKAQISILKSHLKDLSGQIYFEFAIPRMGKRVDNILIIHDIVFVIEFKVGTGDFDRHSIEQVIDYTIDLKNFHEGSHNIKLTPVLVATNGKYQMEHIEDVKLHITAAKANK